MKKYVRDYLRFYGFVKGDIVKCEKCPKEGYVEQMNLHHKIFKSQGGTDEPSNLQILCFDCHHKIHNG